MNAIRCVDLVHTLQHLIPCLCPDTRLPVPYSFQHSGQSSFLMLTRPKILMLPHTLSVSILQGILLIPIPFSSIPRQLQ
jgi:hypothetical protein